MRTRFRQADYADEYAMWTLAYAWVCRQCKHAPANADVWDLRWAGLNRVCSFSTSFCQQIPTFPGAGIWTEGGLSGHVVCGRRSCTEVGNPQSGRLIAET